MRKKIEEEKKKRADETERAKTFMVKFLEFVGALNAALLSDNETKALLMTVALNSYRQIRVIEKKRPDLIPNNIFQNEFNNNTNIVPSVAPNNNNNMHVTEARSSDSDELGSFDEDYWTDQSMEM